MTVDLRNRSFLALQDFSAEEISYLLDLSAELKRAKRAGAEQPKLQGKNIALIFEKTSTRTRCAFEAAAYDQGAHVTYLEPSGSQIGKKESIKDTARVLGRMYHAIEYRGFEQQRVEILAAHAGVPVYNGLTNEAHPTQVLADLLTMAENSDQLLPRISFAYLGDARNNVGQSLLLGAALMGMDFRSVAPRSLQPAQETIHLAEEMARRSGARLLFTENVPQGVQGCDFLYTDVWVSMGEPESVWRERIEVLQAYQINRRVMDLSGNPQVKFLHCLPAFHNRETEIGEKIFRAFGLPAMEVTEEVFESPASLVFEQAENRLHTIKAILVATLYG